MKIVVQRVQQSSVSVHQKQIGSIQKGLLVLAGFEKEDTQQEIDWINHKLLHMRIFEDDQGKMNRSVIDINGELLIIPNFTLCAAVEKGNRPSFTAAESPGKARILFNAMLESLKESSSLRIERGDFGADMQVSLTNDGPVTIILQKQFN